MQIFKFGPEVGRVITQFESNFVMSRVVATKQPSHIGCMHLEQNGIIGLHQASCPQLLLIVSGHGWVRTDAAGEVAVGVGDAVFWDRGEWHETRTDTGLIAIVVESDELNPADFMPSRL